MLHDNQLPAIPDLAPCTSLRTLEVSYNQVRTLAPLASLAAPLRELYAACNKVTAIESLEHFWPSLRVLELGSNRLREVAGLDGAGALGELWLGRNRITAVAGLAGLTSLRKLSLQSNRLTSMAGVGEAPGLEELYLSHNGIAALADLGRLPRLRVLDVSSNAALADVADLAAAAPLTDLWLNNTALPSLGALAGALGAGGAGARVTCAYLAATPAVAGLEKGDYVAAVRGMMPALTVLDGDDVPAGVGGGG